VSRVFLLSPASCRGARASVLLNPRAGFDLARRLRGGGASLGEAFAFLSGLYFRGKLRYAVAFADPPEGAPGVLVITPGEGLVPPDSVVTAETLERFAEVPIDLSTPRYVEPLLRDALAIAGRAGPACEFVLLGSVATGKYVEPLRSVFGAQLCFPPAFVGRGDMSRGGLLLRCADAGQPLDYAPLERCHRGTRPPRLPPRRPQPKP
jgi:hypothetical protein